MRIDNIASVIANQIADIINEMVPEGVELIVKIGDDQCDVRLIYHGPPEDKVRVGLGSCPIYIGLTQAPC
jgi:hypothetical protein